MIDKFRAIGILNDARIVDGRYLQEEHGFNMFFSKTPYSDTLSQLLESYFEHSTR
ncbi:MAG: hypothetical protein PHR87_05865 [Sulfurospirillaceae bacterium]|nr:hypothetical protein [Sulfurospirillaceae bacterium]